MHSDGGSPTLKPANGGLDEILGAMTAAVAALDEKGVRALAEEALANEATGLAVVHACEEGMRLVGERYERQEVFLAGLIMAGEIFRQVMTVTQFSPEIEMTSTGTGVGSGKVLLGTVAGDIHNIGKNMVRMALRSFGFTVADLGVDVPPARFVEEARSFEPDVIGLSGLLSASYESMRTTIGLLNADAGESGRRCPVVIGGGTIDERVCSFVGADYWTTDAMEGMRICQRITSGG